MPKPVVFLGSVNRFMGCIGLKPMVASVHKSSYLRRHVGNGEEKGRGGFTPTGPQLTNAREVCCEEGRPVQCKRSRSDDSGQRRGGDRTCGRLKRLLLEEWRVLIFRCCACRAQRNSMAWGQAFGPVALVVFPVGHVKEQASRHLTKPMLSRGSPVQATSLRQ